MYLRVSFKNQPRTFISNYTLMNKFAENLPHIKDLEFLDFQFCKNSTSRFIYYYVVECTKFFSFHPPLLTEYFNEINQKKDLQCFRIFLIVNLFNMMLLYEESDTVSLQHQFFHFLSTSIITYYHAWVLMVTLRKKEIFNFAGYSMLELIIATLFLYLPRQPDIALSYNYFNFTSSILVSTLLLSRMHIYRTILYGTIFYFANQYTRVYEAIKLPYFNIYWPIIIELGFTLLLSSIAIMNYLMKRTILVRIVQLAKAKERLEKQASSAHLWIEAIMPKTASVEYTEMCSLNRHKPKQWWLYLKSYENVSILFADIVGFTKMSSNKTAIQIVKLLNDLFQRFDLLCQKTRCEKLGTLGDCYYCVAGCPIPQKDHAVCCIEMGLGMCRIIKKFNAIHHESVNMRVGIHTGRVNAGIIGKERFRYDAYSNDVIIANLMESSGRPGRVHISETTLNETINDYNFGIGEVVQVWELVDTGRGVKKPILKDMKTYYVDPRSSHLKNHRQDNLFVHKDDIMIEGNSLEPERSSATETNTGDSITFIEVSEIDKDCSTFIDKSTYYDEVCSDVNLINRMHLYFKELGDVFEQLPTKKFTQAFEDLDEEWNYQFHCQEPAKPLHIDSMKLIRLISFFLNTFCGVVFAAYILKIFVETKNEYIDCFIVFFIAYIFVYFVLLKCMVWSSFNFVTTVKPNFKNSFIFFLNPIVREFIFFFLGIMHSCWMLAYGYFIQSDGLNLVKSESMLILQALNLTLSVSVPYSKWLIRVFEIMLKQIIFYIAHNVVTQVKNTKNRQDPVLILKNHYSPSLMYFITMSTLTSIAIAFHREKNDRTCFHIKRDTDIALDHSKLVTKETKKLLHNIIPPYVLDHIGFGQGTAINEINYAVKIDECGVTFVSISNFFSSFYREDYRGGEEALKLLNRIICTFDNLLEKYGNVEKIKTINDNYMAAAGLNLEERNKSELRDWHLIELLYYCFDLRDALNQINHDYMIGEDNFQIKIGYNIGNLTAGIIGNVKPLYDIWGDTVNVASRMYSTSDEGKIQVPNYVANRLDRYFYFTKRGTVFVKGKGKMETYEAVRPIKSFGNLIENDNKTH